MKIIWRHHYLARFSIFLITVALIAGMAGCFVFGILRLAIDSTEGGSVTEPGEGVFLHGEGTVVILEAEAEEDYQFVNWAGDVDTIADVNAATTTISMQGDYGLMAIFEYTP